MTKNLLTAALAASLVSAACDPAATVPEDEADAAGDERTISPSTDATSLDAGDAGDAEPPLIDAQVDASTDAGADAATDAAPPDASLCPPFDPGPAPPVGAGALDELVDGPPISAPGGVAAEQLALTGRPGAAPDLLVVRGGRVESLRADGAMRWRSPAFGALSITSVVDLNGDGRPEVLARSQRQLRAFDAITGTLRWTLPERPFGDETVIGGLHRVMLADIDDGGRPWLFVTDNGCGGSDGTARTAALRFASGDANADGAFDIVETRAVLPPLTRCGQSFTLADLNGDERLELVQPGNGVLRSVDPETGAVQVCGPVTGLMSGNMPTWARALSAGSAQASLLAHVGNALVRLDASDAPASGDCAPGSTALVERWRVPLGTVTRPESLATFDLTGDGTADVLVSGIDRAGDDVWRTFAVDGQSGEVLWRADATVLLGAVELGDGPRVLVRTDAPPVLDRFGSVALARPTRAGLTLTWTQPDTALPVERRDASTYTARSHARALVTRGDRVVTLERDPATGVTGAVVEVGADGVARRFETNGDVGAVDVRCDDAAGACTLAVALSTGGVAVLDAEMTLINPGEPPESPAARAPAGSATLLAVPVEDGGGVVGMLPDGTLARLDLSQVDAPRIWGVRLSSGQGSTRPVLLRAAGGGARVVRRDYRTSDALALTAFDVGTGAPVWTDTLPTAEFGDGAQQFAVDIDADGVEDLLRFDLFKRPDADCRTGTESERQVRALSGVNGALLWQWRAPPTVACGGVASERMSLADADADGTPEVYITETEAIVRLSVRDGRESGRARIDRLPSASRGGGQVIATGRPEAPLLRFGGNGPIEARAADMSLLWRADEALSSGVRTWIDRPAHVVDDTVWVSPEVGRPVVVLDLMTGAPVREIGVRDGAETAPPESATFAGFQDVPLPTAGVEFGVLAVTDEATLYAFDRGGALLWSRSVDAQPRMPVVADLDADGVNELLVSTNDGQIVLADDRPPPRSLAAWDLPCPPPLSCGPDDDIDASSDTERLCAAWRPAAGATGYVARPVGEDGAALGAWRDVGPSTQVTFAGLPLAAGQRYCVEVRARQSFGDVARLSAPTRTDCLTVVDDAPPTIRLSIDDAALSRIDPPARVTLTMTDDRALAAWRLELFEPGGRLVASIDRGQADGTAWTVQRPWGGRTSGGKAVPAGRYRLVGTAQDVAGAEASDGIEVTLCDADACP